MCTCIAFKTKDHYFGRTLDFEYRYDEQIVITPRNYTFQFHSGEEDKTHYAMIGTAKVVKNYPLYFEAVNEKGLAMAGLNFPQSACYFKPQEGKLNLAPYELIPYFLGKYETVEQCRHDLEKLNIVDIPFMEGLPLSSLHWMMSDGTKCIVIEQMKEGLKIYDNPLEIMTNNPPFSYYQYHICNYRNLNASDGENHFAPTTNLTPYGRGMGAIGLPGDCSPVSRFIRGAFNKNNSVCLDDEESSVTQFFHILDSVSLVQGATITENGEHDITNYTCCINTDKGIYYYKTYWNNQIGVIKMTEENKNKEELSVYSMVERQHFSYEN